MAKQDTENHTPHRPVRVNTKRWDAFGVLVGIRARTSVVNEFIAWYIGEPNAKMPKRPKDAPTYEELVAAGESRRAAQS